jgi:predicted nucleic acid-binding protein
VTCLLDTNVVSELIAKRPDRRVLRWIDGMDPNDACLSVITVGEIHRGVEKLPESKKKDALRAWLHGDLLARFDGRILPIDVGTMLTWGSLVARLEQRGRILPAVDSLVAAIALHHGCRLATRNVDDFLDTGLTVVNPWQ